MRTLTRIVTQIQTQILNLAANLQDHNRIPQAAVPILEKTCSGVFTFGDDPGAGNVVKLCGNFMIACAIEAIRDSTILFFKTYRP